MNEKGNKYTEDISLGTPWPKETEEKEYNVFIEILYEALRYIVIIISIILLTKL